MQAWRAFYSILVALTVLVLGASLPSFGMSHFETSTAPKSFAVFVARYNTKNNRAEGGVAGTAFFISPTRAITAYHVLQASSFEPGADFERVKVWLVRENRQAIEVQYAHLHELKDSDMTIIDFKDAKADLDHEVFPVGGDAELLSSKEVLQTEGFIANSVGPVLAKQGADLVIVSVPKLQRQSAQGALLQATVVDLRAKDVTLKKAPCLNVGYKPVVGLSGGPLLVKGRVVGMNSFADPLQVSTWALQLHRSQVLQAF